MAGSWQTLQIFLFLTHPPSYLSISHVQSQVTLVTTWNCPDAVSLEPVWCLCLTGSLVGEGGDSLTILAPKQWVALMLLLLCSRKRWLAVWLPVSSPEPAQDFATWGSTDFKTDLARMSHLSLMYVHYWWERKEAGILAGCDIRLLSTALSQCIR